MDVLRVAAARSLLASYFGPTPLSRAEALSAPGHALYLKNETVLPTGSFKVRGALYALSAALARGPVREVVAASTGNHGAAVAFAGEKLGVPARVFLPRDSNPVKVARIRALGATLVEAGADLSAAIDAANDHATRAGALFLHDASSADVPIGTATIGAELLEQLPGLDAAYIPMGDTALIRGVSTALRSAPRRIRIVGVVAEAAPAYRLSWKAGPVVETGPVQTMADGLAVRRPLAPNVDAIRELIDDVVVVGEGEMVDAIVRLHENEGLVAEPSGAAALAAWFRDTARQGIGVALVTGRNISPDLARTCGIAIEMP
ncbi:MAG TPA: pyridoxal-phosphate dependent enzyme [Vicinamibacterales bacterium]|nr:pyridoxal-phosphate dependent enzyme [Vicinamibacterales bacterium]